MCTTCGCSPLAAPGPRAPADPDGASFVPVPERGGESAKRIALEAAILGKNDRRAGQNREWLARRSITAFNLLSSPGAGKTTLLERTIRERGAELRLHVIEGDQATAFDAARIRAAGAPVLQVNTGTGCHLDAEMVALGLERLDPPEGSTLMIENVGNLVCPALFDLGERARVVIASVTEGEDKPLKYPHMFRSCDAVVLNKIDLRPHVGFDDARFRDCLRQVNARAPVIELSARTGAGLGAWHAWLDGWRG